MHRVGRDSAWFLKETTRGEANLAVFVFGEIDVRCHIEKVAISSKVPVQEIIQQLVSRYLSALHRNSSYPRNVIVGVPPPADGPGLENREFPVFGTIQRRIEITRELNDRLAKECSSQGFLFLKIPSFYENSSGTLDPMLSDGSVHVRPEFAWPVVKNLETLTGNRLILEDPIVLNKSFLVGPPFSFIKKLLWK